LTALLLSRHAAFEVDSADDVAKEGWSVIVAGPVEEIDRPLELQRAKRLSVEPWAPETGRTVAIKTAKVSGVRIHRNGTSRGWSP